MSLSDRFPSTSLRQDRNNATTLPYKKVRSAAPVSVQLIDSNEWWHHFSTTKPLLAGRSYIRVKRIVDLALVALSAPMTFTLLAICALLIKLESPDGPILFIQHRTGKDGRVFPMYKFRTMVPDAEQLKHTYRALNELQWPDFKITDDPRITRIGRILRKTSLDELPQLINIVRGDMSFVGPRPTSFSVDTYELWHTVRLEVTPGLTGLWQVVGRGATEFDERVRLDYAYIKNRSIAFDFAILFHTGKAAFQGK